MSSFLFRKITNSGHLSKYFEMAIDLSALRKQLIFRSGNLGMLELDLVVGSWAREKIPTMDRQECLDYNKEVLELETPNIYRKILGTEKNSLENKGYIRDLKIYAEESYKKK